MSTNYEKLQKNKEKTLEHAVSVTRSEDGSKTKQEIPNSAKKKMLDDANAALDENDFSTAIQKMDQLKDAKLNISWHESDDLGNGTKALVRDARYVTDKTQELKHDAGEKYAMQALNVVRAGLSLLETDAVDASIIPAQREEAKAALMDVAKYTLNQVEAEGKTEALNGKSIKEINTYIAETLERYGVENATEKLNFAKEVANFKDEHKHIVTMTSVVDNKEQTKTVIEADIMLNGLTDSQQKMFEKIARLPENERGKQMNNDPELAWYNDMPKYKRELMYDVAGDIATGNKVIPAQLLKDMPGMRNAYDKVTAVQHESGKDPLIVADVLHSGAPATKVKLKNSNVNEKALKEQQESIVAGNIEQLQTFIPDNQGVHLNNLTSETPLNIRGEDFIQKQSEKYSNKNEKTEVISSPINRWRRLGGGRDQEGFDNTLKNLGEDLSNQESLKNTAKYLAEGDSRLMRVVSKVTFGLIPTNHQKATEELTGASTKLDDKAISVLKDAVSTKKNIHETTIFARDDNVNLTVSAKMGIIKSTINNSEGPFKDFDLQKSKENFAATVNFCKSGKDRTGQVMMETSYQAVSRELGVDPKSDIGKKNKIGMVAGGHTQEMAGIQGGTTGCHSIKTNPEFGLDKSSKGLDGIINQKSAKYNSSIKVVKDKERQNTVSKIQNNINDSKKHTKSPIDKSTRIAAQRLSIKKDTTNKDTTDKKTQSPTPQKQQRTGRIMGG